MHESRRIKESSKLDWIAFYCDQKKQQAGFFYIDSTSILIPQQTNINNAATQA
jgi:hypothetical protein